MNVISVARWRVVLLAVVLLAVAGCSSTTFVYNRLGWALPWYVGKYVDLDREQDRRLDELLAPLLDWHRRVELPRYLVLLEQAEALLDRPATADDIAQLALSAKAAWRRTETRVVDAMIILGADLRDAQLAAFIDELRDKQAKREEKYLNRSDASYHDRAYKRLRDNLQDYMGRLSRAQRADLRVATARLQRADRVWMTERALSIDRLEDLLQRNPGWQAKLRDALANREDARPPRHQTLYAYNREIFYATFAEMINGRSEKQDKRLRREIADLREDIENLMVVE